jgi:hypothetical protein
VLPDPATVKKRMDCDGFLVSCPCYCIEAVSRDGGAFERVRSGVYALVLLTDNDLLDRSMADRGLVGNPVLTIESADELVELLDRLPPAVSLVTFDPRRGVNRYWPVPDAREALAG